MQASQVSHWSYSSRATPPQYSGFTICHSIPIDFSFCIHSLQYHAKQVTRPAGAQKVAGKPPSCRDLSKDSKAQSHAQIFHLLDTTTPHPHSSKPAPKPTCSHTQHSIAPHNSQRRQQHHQIHRVSQAPGDLSGTSLTNFIQHHKHHRDSVRHDQQPPPSSSRVFLHG